METLSHAEIEEINAEELALAHGEDEPAVQYDIDFIAESCIDDDLEEWTVKTKATLKEFANKEAYMADWRDSMERLALATANARAHYCKFSEADKLRVEEKLIELRIRLEKGFLQRNFPTYFAEYMLKYQ